MSQQKFIPLMSAGERVPDFFVDVKTGVIYFIKSIGGKKIKFSTREKEWGSKAKNFANRELKKILGKGKERVTNLIKDEIPKYVAVKESEGWKPLTMKNIYNAVKRIDGFWGTRFPHEINRDSMGEWYAWLEVTYPGEQKENPIKYMRNFCYYLAEKVVNGIPLLPAVPKISDPDRKLVRASRQAKKRQIFNSQDFTTVYRAGNDTQKLVALLMYTMAPRVDETLNLRFGKQIILDSEPPVYRWSVGQNKADHFGEHALHPSLIEPLKALAIQRRAEKTDLLFPQKHDNNKALRAQQIGWADWRKNANVGWHWTSHTFRHTCLSNLFNDEKNPQALICKLYRVSLAVALETYIKPTKSGIEKMRTAIEVSI